MVNVNELRIGNWVSLGEYQDVALNKIDPSLCSAYYPILLTPDILEKCGFDKDIDHWYNSPGHEIRILFHDKGVTVCTQSVVRPVYSVHQLQNLYFAMTGTELDVKL